MTALPTLDDAKGSLKAERAYYRQRARDARRRLTVCRALHKQGNLASRHLLLAEVEAGERAREYAEFCKTFDKDRAKLRSNY